MNEQRPPCYFWPLWLLGHSALHLLHRFYGAVLCTEPVDTKKITSKNDWITLWESCSPLCVCWLLHSILVFIFHAFDIHINNSSNSLTYSWRALNNNCWHLQTDACMWSIWIMSNCSARGDMKSPEHTWRSSMDRPDIWSGGSVLFKVVSLSSFFSSFSLSSIIPAVFSSFV